MAMSGKKLVASKEGKTPGYISDEEDVDGDSLAPVGKPRRGLKILMVIAPVLLLVIIAGGLSFAGIIKMPFLSSGRQPVVAQMQFVKIPEMIANLDAGQGNDSYAKMQAELEVPDAASAAAVNAQMPAIVDLFQSYLRTMQPDDLRGAEGLYRLREALLARANVVVAPAAVQDVLFIELIVQ
jgi:flagellar protein FliL